MDSTNIASPSLGLEFEQALVIKTHDNSKFPLSPFTLKDLQLRFLSFLNIRDISALTLTCKQIKMIENDAFYNHLQFQYHFASDLENHKIGLSFFESSISKISNDEIHDEFQIFKKEIFSEMEELQKHLKSDAKNYLKKFSKKCEYIPLSAERAKFNRKFISFVQNLNNLGIIFGNNIPWFLDKLMHPTPYTFRDDSNTLFISRSGLKTIGRPATEKEEKENFNKQFGIFKIKDLNNPDKILAIPSCFKQEKERDNYKNNWEINSLLNEYSLKNTFSIGKMDILPSGAGGDGDSGDEPPVSGANLNFSNQQLENLSGKTWEVLNQPRLNPSRFFCIALTILTPFVQPILLIGNIAYRSLKLVSFSHFWIKRNEESLVGYQFKARLESAGVDILRIIASPIALVGYELTAIYSVLKSREGLSVYLKIFDFMHPCNNFYSYLT